MNADLNLTLLLLVVLIADLKIDAPVAARRFCQWTGLSLSSWGLCRLNQSQGGMCISGS